MATNGKHVRPAPVYEAHFADGAVERMSFSWPKGKSLDPSRGKRGCILAYNGDVWRRLHPPHRQSMRECYLAREKIGGVYLKPPAKPQATYTVGSYMDPAMFRKEVEFRLSYDAPFVRGFVEHPLIGRIEDTGEPIKTAARKMPRGELAAQVRCLVKWIIDQPGAPASVVATALEIYEAA